MYKIIIFNIVFILLIFGLSDAVMAQDTVKITAEHLYEEYKSDATSANAEYRNKVLEVTGTVARTGNVVGSPYVLLTGDSQSESEGVRCVFAKEGESQLAGLEPGQNIIIWGICNGYFLNNVILLECSLTESSMPTIAPPPPSQESTQKESNTATLPPASESSEGSTPPQPPQPPAATPPQSASDEIPSKLNWPLIGGVIAGTVVIYTLIFLVAKR